MDTLKERFSVNLSVVIINHCQCPSTVNGVWFRHLGQRFIARIAKQFVQSVKETNKRSRVL
jgi:hypothetical protein